MYDKVVSKTAALRVVFFGNLKKEGALKSPPPIRAKV